jgi:GntR family transcriptional repressor for pyruvate dehydrogenase complex
MESPGRESLADQVVVILKRFILVDNLPPASRIPSERRLADTLNVSRTVLREALSRLIGEGLLVRSSPRVLEVAPFNREALAASMSLLNDRDMKFRGLMELRYILEMGAIRIIVEKLTPESLAAIQYWAEESERRLLRGDPGHISDVNFHASLLRVLGNPTVEGLLPVIEEQIREYLLLDPHQLAGGIKLSDQRVAREHRDAALRKGDHEPVAAIAPEKRLQ